MNITPSTAAGVVFGAFIDLIDFYAGWIPVIGALIDAIAPTGLWLITRDNRSLFLFGELVTDVLPPIAEVFDFIPDTTLIALWILVKEDD